MDFYLMGIVMLWYEHELMIYKYRWLFYLGLFVGILFALIIGLIFYEQPKKEESPC